MVALVISIAATVSCEYKSCEQARRAWLLAFAATPTLIAHPRAGNNNEDAALLRKTRQARVRRMHQTRSSHQNFSKGKLTELETPSFKVHVKTTSSVWANSQRQSPSER